MEKQFNIAMWIEGYKGHPQDNTSTEFASDIVAMAAVLQKPSMFKDIPWYITDMDTGELLAYNEAFSSHGVKGGVYIADVVHNGYC